jgi:hypothetical protein
VNIPGQKPAKMPAPPTGTDEYGYAVEDPEEAKRKQQTVDEICRWFKRVTHARDHCKPDRERWAKDRKLAAGDPEGPEWEVTANLIGANLEVVLAFLYAKNPDISCRVAPSAGRANVADFRIIAETIQIVVSRLLKDAGLKRKAKAWIRSAMTVGIGWLRANMQTRRENDPIVQTQINDLQNNMASLVASRKALASGECADLDAEIANMEAQQIALNEKLELVIATGLTLDVVKPEDVTVATECAEVEDYFDAPWIAFDTYKMISQAKTLCTLWGDNAEEILKGASRFVQRPRSGEDASDYGSGKSNYSEAGGSPEDESVEGFVRFVEIWSLEDGLVRTYVEGIKDRWAREPYAPRTWSRFYPLFGVTFNPVDGLRYPQSDVSRQRSLQREYSRTRSSEAEHRKRAIPGIIFNEEAVDEGSVTKMTGSARQEYIGVKMVKPDMDVRTVFAPKVYNQVDPTLYDTSHTLRDMAQISGASEALQSAVAVEKTATEARIENTGFSTRTNARRDNVEDALADLAEYTAQIALQTLDQAAAVKYAGPDAAWMQLSPEQALTLFSVEIEAGSTGKPHANADRDAWGVLLPLIQGMIQQIAQMRAGGPQNEWLVTPMVNLLQETLNRMDDPADAEMFLPVPPPPTPIIDPSTGQPVIDPMTGQPVMQQPQMPGMPPPGGPGAAPTPGPTPAGAPALPTTA